MPRRMRVLGAFVAISLVLLVGRMVYLAAAHDQLEQERGAKIRQAAQVVQPSGADSDG